MADMLSWQAKWETDLLPDEHRDISYMLRLAFPYTTTIFASSRSWAGARPERRIIARSGSHVVAHAALLRRFIRVSGVDQLVGEVGLVAVHPGLAAAQPGEPIVALSTELIDRLSEALIDMAVPFGFTNTRAELTATYVARGWRVLPDIRTRHLELSQPLRAVTLDYPAVVLPVTATYGEWPAGAMIERNGSET